MISRELQRTKLKTVCVQPFLTPVPPVNSDVLATILLPFGYVLGVIRTALVAALGVLYVLLVGGVCAILVRVLHILNLTLAEVKLQTPAPPLYRAVSHAFTALITRLVLLLVGVWWIPVEIVTRKRT